MAEEEEEEEEEKEEGVWYRWEEVECKYKKNGAGIEKLMRKTREMQGIFWNSFI